MLKSILKIIGLRGQRTINEVTIQKNKILVTSPDQSVAIRLIAKEPILESKESIGLQKLDILKKYLELCSDKVKIKIEDNRLYLSEGRKKISVLLKATQFISTNVEEKNFDKIFNLLSDGVKVKVNLKDLKALETYVSNSEATFFEMEVKDKELKINILEQNKDNITDVIELIEGKGTAKVKLGNSFIDAIQGLEEEVELVIKDNCPILIKQQTENYSVEFLVAEVE